MKKTLSFLALTLCLATASFAQTVALDTVSNKYTAQAVVEFGPELTKEILFERAKEWTALFYNTAEETTTFASLESGKIVCKGSFPTSMFMRPGRLKHKLVLDFKDGRMRYSYTDLTYYDAETGNYELERKWAKGKQNKAISDVETKAKMSIDSLKEYLKGTLPKTDNW